MSLAAPVIEAPRASQLRESLQSRAAGLAGASWNALSEAVAGLQMGRPAAQQGQGAPGDGWFKEGSADFSGLGDNVPRSLINTESGGNWGATNNEVGSSGRAGHHGLLQFGLDRLDDAKRAGVIPAGMTPEQFRQSPKAQIAASNWHFNDIDRNIRAHDLAKYSGQVVGGIQMTPNGMRAIAHLGGFGGLQKFLRSDGRYNPSDSFGTSLKDYGRIHGA